MRYKYLLLLFSSLLFFSCEMKKEILGQTDKGQTRVTRRRNRVAGSGVEAEKRSGYSCFEGRKCYWFADCYIGCQ